MHALASLILLCAAAATETGLAPDQPLPFVYADDPLILEVRATEDAAANIHLTVEAADTGESSEADMPGVPLRAGDSRWLAFSDLPPRKGYYTARIEIETGGTTTTKTEQFCRIDRPAECSGTGEAPAKSLLPLVARANGASPSVLLTLGNLGIRTLYVEADQEGAEDALSEAAEHGFEITVGLQARSAGKEKITGLAEAYPGIAGWSLVPGQDPKSLAMAVKDIRAAGSQAPIYAIIQQPEEWAALLEGDAVRDVRGMVLPLAKFGAAAGAVRQLSENQGYESWSMFAGALEHARREDSAALLLLHQFFDALAEGASSMCFDASWIYDGAAGPWMAYLNGLAQRMEGQRYAGELQAAPGVGVPVFRTAGKWFMPLWTSGADKEGKLDLAGAEDLTLTDAFNNPLPAPAAGEWSVKLTKRPLYLTGKNGAVLADAARSLAVTLAKQFAANDKYDRYLAPGLLSLAGNIAVSPGGENSRARFFQLLQSLPELERAWHSGELPRTVAVPAIADVARLARRLCVVEESRGEPFLEPLRDTLENCDEYLSLYLTGSVGTSQAYERGDWLLNEVQDLTGEAETLSQQNRPIESSAVAALAEWRARALAFAAKAGPLSDTVQELPEAPREVPAEDIAEEPIVIAEAAPPEVIPEPVPPLEPGQPAGTKKLIHVVVSGDSSSRIASKYDVALNDLLQWNGLTVRSVLHLKDELKLYVPADSLAAEEEIPAEAAAPPGDAADSESPPAPEAPLEAGQPAGTKKIVHVVKRGDNPDAIARKYGVALDDFLKWNKLRRNSTIHIGDEYVAYVPGRQ